MANKDKKPVYEDDWSPPDPIDLDKITDASEMWLARHSGQLDDNPAKVGIGLLLRELGIQQFRDYDEAERKKDRKKSGASAGKNSAEVRKESSDIMRDVIRDKFEELKRRHPRSRKSTLIEKHLIPWLKDNEIQLMEEHQIKKAVYGKSNIYTFLK